MTIKNIYLVRHGESLANVNKAIHHELPDHRIGLSELGKKQALAAGQAFNNLYGVYSGDASKLAIWLSPYDRTRQTTDYFVSGLNKQVTQNIIYRRENIALCEQHFGLFDGIEDDELAKTFPIEFAHYNKAVEHEGKFWASMPMGESRFDVAMRVQTSFALIKEEAREKNIENVIIVTHGVAMRAIIMQWRNHPYEWFEQETNPGNCDIYRLAAQPKYDGYIHRTTLFE